MTRTVFRSLAAAGLAAVLAAAAGGAQSEASPSRCVGFQTFDSVGNARRERAALFASQIGPQRLINISEFASGSWREVTVWYWVPCGS